ncbi:hypothetical protein GM658_16795 [Pseudoduganella eburnea]|uniref:Uncharacterized protein n=1 Tax=Massilia eburnea TaxID=1776165 RepID=A0A6L6QKS6_9BURK|nr:hypothetical protein [Massilia eburnea]MTW12266.1 hypothetical protein [Massilia eburnea]
MRRATLALAALAGLTACAGNSIDYAYSSARIGNLEIRIVNSPVGASFDLAGVSPAAGKINAYTKHWRDEQAASARECRSNGDPGWQSKLTAKQVIGRYLLVIDETGQNVCGGALDNSHHYTDIFDLDSGDKVNACGWLAGRCEGLENYGHPLSRLGEMIKERARTSPGCQILSSMYGVPEPYPTADGLAFPTIHDAKDCDVEVLVSYDEIAPFLSAEGKKVVAGLKGLR